MTDLRELLVAEPGKVRLADIDPRSTPGLPDRRLPGGDPKLWSRAQVASIGQLLAGCQERLLASAEVGATKQRVLLVLQAMDCGGKDGTGSTTRATWTWYRNGAVATLLRQAFEDVNPQYPAPEFDVTAERERLAAE